MVLDNLSPNRVFYFFEQLCAIPHGSGNTKQISDFCAKFAADRGLKYCQDATNNVVIFKDATEGYENAEPVIIQGHMDMVCDKAIGSDFNFFTDGLKLHTDGEKVWAEDTTLGGDDGIAIAMAMALLDSSDIPHPALECVFTVDEETGMYGARDLDCSVLEAKRMLNLDSEDEGIFTVGCAGGVRATSSIPVVREKASGVVVTVTVGGLKGGHSGQEIDKKRGSSNILMGRVLRAVCDASDARLVSLSGGNADNAIPLKTVAELVVCPCKADAVKAAVEKMDAVIKKEYSITDEGVYVTVEFGPEQEVSAVTAESTDKVVSALVIYPFGIQEMSAAIEGLVETSLNLGVLRLEENVCNSTFSIRSSVSSRKEMMKQKIEAISRALGGSVEFRGEYPAWEYMPKSELRDVMVQVFRDQYGKDPQVVAIHAGLECGLISEKIPGLDCVSIGPDLHDIHTCRETMDVKSVERVWNFVLEVLKRLK